MSNVYIRIQDDAPRDTPKRLLIAGYISQLIQYALIIVYCVLSPSLFSTIALLFMLVSFGFSIATPYYIVKRNESRQSIRVFAYPVQRIIWAIFVLVCLAELVFKTIVYFTGISENYNSKYQQFYEVQGLLNVFLPLLLLPFAVGSALIKTKSRDMSHFKHQVNSLIKIPIFLALGLLILLVEIFSISIAGLLFFVCIFILFIQRRIDFSSFLSWLLVLIVQILCLIFIIGNFIAATNLVSQYSLKGEFRFFGINGLNDFLKFETSRGYFICLILLFIVSCLVQRIFAYNKIWQIVSKVEGVAEIRPSRIFGQQGVDFQRISERSQLEQKQIIGGRNTNRYSLQQFQLPQVSVELDPLKRNTQIVNISQRQQTMGEEQIEVQPSKRRTKPQKYQQKDKEKNKKPIGKVIIDSILIGLSKFLQFIYSTEFSLRFTELLCIVIIQRYNNIYSFVAVFWLTLVASTERIRIVYFAALFILLPVEIGNFIILYIYNAPQSPIQTLQNLEMFGFQKMEIFWLDVIIFNLYLFYLITFILSASQEGRQSFHKSQAAPNPKIWVLIVAFLFRYSYLLTLIAVFFLGFSTVTLMNFIYVVLLLVFFSSGQNVLIQTKLRHSRLISSLTTFSRKYWFLIVYYTMICIILKYCYFLFFDGKAYLALQPTGINEQYNWSFNFSLSNVCISNTTPLFIIFVLAQIQIMIYRSSIYRNYSFSLISQMTDMKQSRKDKIRIYINAFIELILEFYYQSLYYISGIVILICSYRWNFMGLFIVIATCIGLIRNFTKALLGFIVFMDLANILINYLILFINYEYVQQVLGEGSVNAIIQIGAFIGLVTDQSVSLAGLFVLNMVIFYFAVQSYGLKKILDENRFNEEGELENLMEKVEDDKESENRQQRRDTLSSYQPTVIESVYEDKQFGKNFNKGVILSTKRLYAVVLWKKYVWWQKICEIIAIFSTDLVTIFVLVCCLCFRLSVSMFYFLFIYMIYYFVLFDNIGSLMEDEDFYQRIERQFKTFKKKQAIICQRNNPKSMITGQQATESVISFINTTKEKATKLKFAWRHQVWLMTAYGSVACLVLTYASQFIVAEFYTDYVTWNSTYILENTLFVLGFSVTKQSTFFRQVYFYFFMVMIAVGQKLLLRFTTAKEEQKIIENVSSTLKKKQYNQLQDPKNFIDENLTFIESAEIDQNVVNTLQRQTFVQQEQDLSSDFAKQSNLLIYFYFKRTHIKINYIYGILMMFLRLYLLMMLINLYQKSSIFAFAYLFAVLFFWFQPLHFKVVRHINKISIVILLLQYLVLLLDITNNTSSLPMPNSQQNLSILRTFISNEQWITYLEINYEKSSSSTNTYLVSFFISAIVVFLTQLYFTVFFEISKLNMRMIREVYDRYEYIEQNLRCMPDQDTIYLNYENYKNWSYRFMTLTYELLINNSYIVVSYIILIILTEVHNYLSIALVCFACIYIYIGIFTGFSEDKKIYTYTAIFFQIVQGILFAVLIMIVIVQIPIFSQTNQVVVYIQNLSNLEQVFLLFLIQIWLDLSLSQQFKQATSQYNQKVRNRENVMIKCIAYQENKDFIKKMLQRYREIMWFEVNLKDALDIIDQWHKAMYKKKIPQFQNLKMAKTTPHIQSLKNDIKKQLERRPQQDETVIDKFTNFMSRNISVALQYRYYEMERYIVFNNHRLIKLENNSIDIWDYVLEDYEKLNDQIKQADAELAKNIKIIQNEEIGDRMDKLEEIKKTSYSEPAGNINEMIMGIIKTPKKIFIDIKIPKDSLPKVMLFFVLSNFSYFLSFFAWIYYMINPCLLSLPFIVYFFSYELISQNKLTSLMLLYIVAIIIGGLLVQLQDSFLSNWVKYLFYQDSNGNYVYSIGYLLFLFILIFINEEIKKYQGNKFKHHHQAQNRMQGAFRILINEDENSHFYLWNYKVQENYEEKQCNPMNYFSQRIEYKAQELTDCPALTFFESFNQGKTGIDLYPLMACIQIFLTIYLIFFYTFMVQGGTTTAEEQFKYFQFSSYMVIAVLVHVISIVLERRITLIRPQNPYKSLIKYCYTMLILALFLIFIYFIAPTNNQIQGIYQPRPFLIAFAFFYFFYFFLSALQIRFGYKKYKSLNSVMTRRRQFNNLIVIVFTSVPFLYELKLMMDYSFCQTSLKIWDWFRLFSIYYSAFKAKMQYYGTTGVKLGEPQPWWQKSIGWLGFIGILIIIFGPMILFSGLNPIAQPNLVIGGALQLGIQIEGGNYFGLYSTSHFSQPPISYTSQLFYQEGFNQVPPLQFLTPKDIPQQFQLVQFEPYSDANWGISYPNYQLLTLLMQKTIQQLQTQQNPSYNFTIVVKYALDRSVAQTISTDTNFLFPNDGPLNLTELQSLYTTFTQCNTPTYLPGFYISLIRLYTIGNSYKPRPIVYVNSSGINPYLQGVYLTLYCDNNASSTSETNNVYWALNSTNSSNSQAATVNGVFLNVLCDKYQNLIGGLGFTALYTSVILVVAGFIRGAFEGNLPQFPYFQNPKPDNIIQISQAIGTLRDRKQFRQEYLMYYQLIDIIRSPDLMKYLSGSYPMLIEQADAKRRKLQQDKLIQSRRDKIQ